MAIKCSAGKDELSGQLEAYLLTLYRLPGVRIVKASPTFKPKVRVSPEPISSGHKHGPDSEPTLQRARGRDLTSLAPNDIKRPVPYPTGILASRESSTALARGRVRILVVKSWL
jgi:hypothetical protein